MIEIHIDNNILDNFSMKNSEYLYYSDYYNNPSGVHEYRLYSYLASFFSNSTILDIGTSHGRSAIALSHNETNKVISYDIIDHIQKLNHKIYSKKNIVFKIKNVLDDLNEKFILDCRLIVIDIDHYGSHEKCIIDKLDKIGFSGIIILDDIYHPDKILYKAMQELWKSIYFPKFDITKYGHSTGTGLILMNCNDIVIKFNNIISKTYNNSPYRQIPPELFNDFTLNNSIPVFDFFCNENINNNKIVWSNKYIDDYIKTYTVTNIENNNNINCPYGIHPVLSLLKSFLKYNITNKQVAVIGSQSPWIEAMLINLNNDVTTIEYNTPECEHPKLKCKNYFKDFKNTKKLYDCIVTFSSIEHSGLGRYGDPLDPNGDFIAMNDIRSNLKENGLCIWGAPVGADALCWNAHRIYGKIRLPLIFKNFIEIEWFGDKNTLLNLHQTKDAVYQPVVVLMKT